MAIPKPISTAVSYTTVTCSLTLGCQSSQIPIRFQDKFELKGVKSVRYPCNNIIIRLPKKITVEKFRDYSWEYMKKVLRWLDKCFQKKIGRNQSASRILSLELGLELIRHVNVRRGTGKFTNWWVEVFANVTG